MQLQIYNISNYMYNDTATAIQMISTTDLYKNVDLSPDKSCTNLIILEETRLMANCKSRYKINNTQSAQTGSSSSSGDREIMGISIIIDVVDMTKPNFRFFNNGNDFLSMKDGEYRFFKKIGYTYMILEKKYKTYCYFSVMAYDGFLQPKLIRQIYRFDNPAAYYQVDLNKIYQDQVTPIQVGLEQSKCQQQSMIDRSADKMEFLQIQDIDLLHQYDNLVVASDYNYGILFMNITCPNTTYCYYTPHYHIRDNGIGKIYVMDKDSDLEYQVMFVEKLSPPGILEINLENINSPFVQRSYYLTEDGNNFISVGIIAANTKYIITQFMSLQDMKPVLRIIKRDAQRFSAGLTGYKFMDFFDSGLYIDFFSPFEDYFLMKTSDIFQIFKIQQVELVINANDLNFSIQDTLLADHSLRVNLKVYESDNYQQSIETAFKIKFLGQDLSNQTFQIYQGLHNNGSIQVDYSCASESDDFIDFTSYFDGPRTYFEMISLNDNSQDYFELVQNWNSESIVYTYQVENCYLPAILSLKSYVSNIEQTVLACNLYLQDKLTIIDAFAERQDHQALVIEEFILPYGSIVEFDSDSKQDVFFVLSNKTAEGITGAVIHIFQQFNRFSWVDSIDLNQEFPQLQNKYRLRSFNSITYDSVNSQGVICSEPYVVKNEMVYKQIIFHLDNTLNGYDISVKAILETKFPLDGNGNPLVSLLTTKINSLGLWLVFSNNTLGLYQMIEIGFHSPGFKSQNPSFTYAYMQKKTFNFTAREFESKQLHNFRAIGNMFALFYGDDGVAILKYFPSIYEFKVVMMLPLYQNDNLQYDNIQYKFVFNSFINIVDTDALGNQVYFLCSRFVNQTFDTYVLFGFDITSNRHQIISIKDSLNITQDQLDQDYFNIRVVSQDANALKIILSLSKDFMMIYKFNKTQAIKLKDDSQNMLKFVQACTNSELSLAYQIYPQGYQSQNITLVVNIKNSGRVIQMEENLAYMTISKDTSATKVPAENLYGRYSLSSSIHGQDVHYSMKCVDQEFNSTNLDFTVSQDQIKQDYHHKCQQIQLTDRAVSAQIRLEFLGSSIQLLGFFMVDQVMLFFDKIYLNAYLPQLYETIKYTFFSGSSMPTQIFMRKSYINATGENFFLLLTSFSDLSFQLTYVFSSYSYDLSQLNKSYYLQIEDSVNILKHDSYGIVNLNISMCEFYVNSNSPNNAMLIFVHDIPQVTFQSRMSFFKVSRDPNLENIVYNQVDDQLLSIYSWQINSFKINSMGVSDDIPILYLGIENYGIIFMNLNTFQIIRMESVQSQLGTLTQFKISQIVFESYQSIYVGIENFGLLSLQYDFKTNMTASDLDFQIINNGSVIIPNPKIVTHLKYDASTQIMGNNWLALSELGFAILERRQIQQDLGQDTYFYHIRFISFYGMDDSKSLGTYDIIEDDDCVFLQTIPSELARMYFLPNIKSEDFFAAASVCANSELVIVAYDYHPQLIFKIPQNNTVIEYTQQVLIEVQNYDDTQCQLQDNQSSTLQSEEISPILKGYIYSLLLTVEVLNQERRIEAIYYVIFISAVAFIMAYLNYLIRNGTKKESQSKAQGKIQSIFQKRKSMMSSTSSGFLGGLQKVFQGFSRFGRKNRGRGSTQSDYMKLQDDNQFENSTMYVDTSGQSYQFTMRSSSSSMDNQNPPIFKHKGTI